MASKQPKEGADAEELLDAAEKTIDRLKTLYEQYFLGIQKQAPSYIHNDVERRLRDLAQMNIRNTGLRYRLATLQQKFGSYNSYWRRTLRQIENGTYARQLQKVGRDAVRSGADIPDEILAAMPKRMRDQVVKDRDVALQIAARRAAEKTELEPPEPDADFIAMIKEPTEVRRKLKGTDGSHLLDGSDGDFDIDAFFAEVEQTDDKPATPSRPRVATKQPQNRTRPTTTGDLIRSGTRPTRDFEAPVKKERADTQSEEPKTNPLATPFPSTPAQGVPRVPQPTQVLKGPPPVPGRATSSIPAIKHDDVEEERMTVKRPAFERPASAAPPPPPGRATGAQPAVPRPGTGPAAAIPSSRATGANPVVPAPAPVSNRTGPQPSVPTPVVTPPRSNIPASNMSSQASRPNPIAPGAAAAKGPVPVEGVGFGSRPTATQGIPAIPKIPTIPKPDVIVTRTPAAGVPARQPVQQRQTPQQGVPAMKPPTGMTDADVNALYAKYVKAKEMVGEKIGPGEHSKLLKTINAQAPKIMEQYKAKGVDFSVVVKDNQVIIRAKPKT